MDDAATYVAETAYDTTFGARPIKRFINKQLTQKTAQMLVVGELKSGQTLRINCDKTGELVLTSTEDRWRDKAIDT